MSTSNIERTAVFAFGAIFLSAILVLVVLIPMRRPPSFLHFASPWRFPLPASARCCRDF